MPRVMGDEKTAADSLLKSPLARLSKKQCDCLDLVLQHCTSKQIAQILKISPYTVDQRLGAAREILGGATRLEAAQRYARLKGIYKPSVYEPFSISDPATDRPMSAQPNFPADLHMEDVGPPAVELIDISPPWSQLVEGRQVARVFVGKDSAWFRVKVIITLTIGLMSAIVLGLAIVQAITGLLPLPDPTPPVQP